MSDHAAAPPAPTFATKAEMYAWLEQQCEYLVDGMSRRLTPQANLVIGLGNVAALCFYELNRFTNPASQLQTLPVNWFGFYLLQAPGMLALGPFQGRPACTEVRVGRGVCGTAAEQAKTLVIANVHDFPGHIACDSASDSEVVVPLLSENGTVLGVIDVDSTVVSHFDEEDGRGLGAIARLLVKFLEFPMARALAVNPALGMPAFSATSGGLPPAPVAVAESSAAVPAGESKVTSAIPFFTIEAVRPDAASKEVRNWVVSTSRLDRIMNQEELQELETGLGIATIPEIQFPFNTLTLARSGPAGDGADRAAPRVALSFNVVAIFKDAAHFYHTPYFNETVRPQLTIPVSEWWANNKYERHDPNVDWAWRHRYFGVPHGELEARLRPLPAGGAGINWELLKDRTLPIAFFDSFDFFEDDLHDSGMSSCSVKFRVMGDQALFVLLRQVVRVDGHALWLREVRFYHEFDREEAAVAKGEAPYVAVEEQYAKLGLEPGSDGQPAVDWKNLSLDELSAKAAVISKEEFALTI